MWQPHSDITVQQGFKKTIRKYCTQVAVWSLMQKVLSNQQVFRIQSLSCCCGETSHRPQSQGNNGLVTIKPCSSGDKTVI